LFVVSGPSGTGKTTLVEALVPRIPSLALSRSYTSRPPRPNERDGVDYNFVTPDRFETMRETGGFLEWANIFGHLYGTSALDTRRQLDAGRDLILVINVQGAREVQRLNAGTIGIFVLPPSPEVLQCRLRQRSGIHLTEEELQGRLTVARQEVECLKDYDYVVVNDDLEVCIEHLRCIILAARQSQRVIGGSVQAVARSFGENG